MTTICHAICILDVINSITFFVNPLSLNRLLENAQSAEIINIQTDLERELCARGWLCLARSMVYLLASE